MEWHYKNIKIFVECDGYFYFTYNNKTDYAYSLIEAKAKIDSVTKNYYNFTKQDLSKMFKKLDEREKDFVNNLMCELRRHEDNAYCEMGISEDMMFDFEIYE